MSEGVRGYFAPWLGGAGTSYVHGGFRSFLAFWMGGASSHTEHPSTTDTHDGFYPGVDEEPRRERRRRQREELDEELRRLYTEVTASAASPDVVERAAEVVVAYTPRRASAVAVPSPDDVDWAGLAADAHQAGQLALNTLRLLLALLAARRRGDPDEEAAVMLLLA